MLKKVHKFLVSHAHLPYVGPVSTWIIVFVFAPLGVVLYYSLLTVGPDNNVVGIFTLKNYRTLINPAYGVIILRTLLFSLIVNVICLFVGYPSAYFIARYGGRRKTFLLFLVIIPSWTCYLIRLFALKTITGTNGLLNSILLTLGVISSPLGILFTPYAVILGLIYTWLPFMILPVYASVEGLDPYLLEAAVDLGATPMRRFFTVTLPLTKGGIFAGTILVFIPSLGAWLVPMLFGGSKVMTVGSLIHLHFIQAGNIPMGSSISVALTAFILLMIYLFIKLGGEEALERIV